MQEALFDGFSLDDHVLADLLRSIDRFVDFSGIREHLRPHNIETGRASIDPELTISEIWIVGVASVMPSVPSGIVLIASQRP